MVKSIISLVSFFAGVYGQTGSQNSQAQLESEFLGTASDFNTTDFSEGIYDLVVGNSITDPSLVGTIAWMVTEAGVNFFGFKLELIAPARNFIYGGTFAFNSVYF